jgi:hypothetical protein
MSVDSKSLTTFFRNQGIYLSIALVIGATFWALSQPINPFTVILYSLCFGKRPQLVFASLNGVSRWRPPTSVSFYTFSCHSN